MAFPQIPGLSEDSTTYLNDEDINCISEYILATKEAQVDSIKGFVSTNDNLEGLEVEDLRKQLFQDFKDSVFSGHTTGKPPKDVILGRQRFTSYQIPPL